VRAYLTNNTTSQQPKKNKNIHDKQRDGTLNNGLSYSKQGLVLGFRVEILSKKCTGGNGLVRKEVRAGFWEWTTVDRVRCGAFNVEARVHEWAKGRKSQRWGYWRRCGGRVAWLRENNGADNREGEVRQLDVSWATKMSWDTAVWEQSRE
jgi:hypothetical protein